MGQKVSGYRRNVPYGTKSLKRNPEREAQDGGYWMFQVNPKGRVGWNRGDGERTERGYGKDLSHAQGRRNQVEECRKVFGCVTNGLGRKGTRKTGYQVYGEYTYGEMEDGEKKQGLIETSSPGMRKRFGSHPEFRQGRHQARLRLTRKREQERQVPVERKRLDLKSRREANPTQVGEKQERKARLSPGRKRERPGERVDAVVLSQSRPVQERRAKLIATELESGIHHMESRRKIEKLRKAKTKLSGQAGPYGYQIQVKGPLGGARRTIVYLIQEGKIPRGSTQGLTRTGFQHAKTSIGTIGVKVTYCYGLG